jgi:hypothetical protein
MTTTLEAPLKHAHSDGLEVHEHMPIHSALLAKLREPFPPEKVGKLPKPTISNEEWKKLTKGHCNVCGGWHATEKTMHLDFVGHADITERLLDVDPEWNWKPMVPAPDGGYALKVNSAGQAYGLWMELTVAGVTRIGYGSVVPGTFDAEKQLIGDALRNAGMRFGMALDLWRKEPPPPVEGGARPARNTAAARAAANGGTATPRLTTVSAEPISEPCPRCAYPDDLEMHEDSVGKRYNGELQLKTLSDGRRFIGCSNYPDCKEMRQPEAQPV